MDTARIVGAGLASGRSAYRRLVRRRAPFTLWHEDCRATMARMPDASVDAVVTDPPYHLSSIVKRFGGPNAAPQQYGSDGAYARAARGFMGQTWDGGDVAFDPALWAEVLRILKPGGYLLAFGGTRTYHRMACAVEDAGFEIRDMVTWLYGSGFPKSKDQGEGRGTALKPAQEPICMARKPLIGSCGQNLLEHGTGALNIDACRIPIGEADRQEMSGRSGKSNTSIFGGINGAGGTHSGWEPTTGRFPANVIHDGSDEVVAIFPHDAGADSPVRGDEPSNVTDRIYGRFTGRVPGVFYGDQGGAERFFYCAKASKRDREEGLDRLPMGVLARSNLAQTLEAEGDMVAEAGGGFNAARLRKNIHPTVKPTSLMRYLCRLVTPAGGVVFDPFTGSGSTGKAAMLEGFRFIGAELTAEYVPIARARIVHALETRNARAD